MSLDKKYRPRTYDEVQGQDHHVTVLRQFVIEGKGHQQSYLFAGAKGCGKTTLGRIMARALLCESPVDGGPCDDCDSCNAMLQDPPAHECFTEMDAATNSGKDQIQQIVETQRYETFSGRRRVYLIDECHRLSIQAMDGLLKSLEDTIPGSDDRMLLCIFATTEPDKVRGTISSRCAPTFTIQKLNPDDLGGYLAFICEKEGIPCDLDALKVIAETTHCHIRDSLQALSGVSMKGHVNVENVRDYLGLDAENSYLTILTNLGRDLRTVIHAADDLKARVSPSGCYAGLAEAAMTVFKVRALGLGSLPSFWDSGRLDGLTEAGAKRLVEISQWLSKRPSRATHSMLLCDLSTLHQRLAGGVPLATRDAVVVIQETAASPSGGASSAQTAPVRAPSPEPEVPTGSPSATDSAEAAAGTVATPSPPLEGEQPLSTQKTRDGVYVDERCRNNNESKVVHGDAGIDLGVDVGRQVLLARLRELSSGQGSTRPADVGDA